MRNAFPGLVLLILSFTLSLEAQHQNFTYPFDPTYFFEDREIEVYNYNANLIIQPYDTLVAGEVEFSFKTLREKIDSIVFHVPEMNISEVRIGGVKAETVHKGIHVMVLPPFELQWQQHYKILFIYDVKPTDGLYFTGWNDPQQLKRKQIWAHRPNHWLPYFPAVLTTQMAVTVPENLKVFSNGERKAVVTNKDNTRTWHYKMNHPHPFFSTCLVIGNMEWKSMETKTGMPIELWYYPDQEDHFEPTYRYQLEMFDFLEQEFGFAYPYEVYRQAPVVDYMYGAMETTTATIFGDYLMVDDRAFFGRNYINVNAHELVHQWFGNYISHLKHRDVWLTESFATYFAKMFEKHIFGENYYQADRHKELADVLSAAQRNSLPVMHSRSGRERIYQKGSLVFDMLRDVMGDSEFKAVMQYYLEQYPYQTAESNDFLQAIRKVTGRSMEWFFEQWIFRGGEPEYSISFEQVTNENLAGEVRIQVKQIHPTNELTGLFKMPIGFEVYFSDGSRQKTTQWIEKQFEQVIIANPENKTVDFVLFDPNRKIIKKTVFPRTYQQLISQAGKAQNMIDRFDALVALREVEPQQKMNDLIDLYRNESFHLTKTEIITQLTPMMHEPAVEKMMIAAAHDADDKVRLAVLQNVKHIGASLQPAYENMLKDESYFNAGLALENLCLSFPESIGKYLEIMADETGWRGMNIRMKWLEIAIGSGQTEFIPELKNYTSLSYEFETRINAMQVLQKLNIFDETVADNLLQGLFYWNFKVRNAARESLAYFYKQTDYRKIIDHAIEKGKFAPSQRQQIAVWLNG